MAAALFAGAASGGGRAGVNCHLSTFGCRVDGVLAPNHSRASRPQAPETRDCSLRCRSLAIWEALACCGTLNSPQIGNRTYQRRPVQGLLDEVLRALDEEVCAFELVLRIQYT